MGHLLALLVTPADTQDRAQGGQLAAIPAASGETMELAYLDQGYTGVAATVAAEHGIHLEVVKLAEARCGFVLLPRRWVVERSFAWTGRIRRLAREYERLQTTLAGFHFLAFSLVALHAVMPALGVL